MSDTPIRFYGQVNVTAEPMTEAEYHRNQGFSSHPDTANMPGYKVTFHNGETGWLTSADFHATYLNAGVGLSYSQALDELRRGKAIYRNGWNGRNMHVFAESGARIKGSRRDYYLEPFFVIRTAQGICNTWVPSISDQQALDWHSVTFLPGDVVWEKKKPQAMTVSKEENGKVYVEWLDAEKHHKSDLFTVDQLAYFYAEESVSAGPGNDTTHMD